MKEFDFEKVPIVEIANEILLDGVKKGASDIHFDPTKDGIKIRMRVDGILYDYANVPAEFKRNMVSRIKMIASMNIMETRLPQDGAIKSKIGDKTLDLRVSSLPTNIGEKVVLRILDYSKSLQGLETLGFSDHNLQKIFKMIDIPNGIVLVTGATGSGKSTTVYSILQKLNTSEVNIITVEDPVEMDVEGINQVQAQQEIGLDFAAVLRSILRQDPDIIMIGEIRDSETASIAVRASITGHKVLSTIHTNSALNTIERLTDMGVERYLIGTSLNGVISQKLARKLCPHCRIVRETTDYEKELFRKVLHKDVLKIYDLNPDGCEHCFRGYKGRICIAEVLVITDEVRSAITNSAPKDVMRKLVYLDANTHTLLEDGLEKVLVGETNFDEVLKLVDLENDLAIHNAHYDEIEEKLHGKKSDEDEDVEVVYEVEEDGEDDDPNAEYVYVDEDGNEISYDEIKDTLEEEEEVEEEETEDEEKTEEESDDETEEEAEEEEEEIEEEVEEEIEDDFEDEKKDNKKNSPKVETPVKNDEDDKEEPKVEDKKDEPKEEKKDEPEVEDKKDEPKEEKKDEPKEEEKALDKEEPKELPPLDIKIEEPKPLPSLDKPEDKKDDKDLPSLDNLEDKNDKFKLDLPSLDEIEKLASDKEKEDKKEEELFGQANPTITFEPIHNNNDDLNNEPNNIKINNTLNTSVDYTSLIPNIKGPNPNVIVGKPEN